MAIALLLGCQAEDRLASGPTDGTLPSGVRGYAFYLDVDIERGTVRVIPPTEPGAGQSADGLAYSLLGNDILGLTTANFFRSTIGQVVPNKRTITFDILLTNRLSVSDLVTPTFPLPPHGVQGLLAFPYTVAAFGVQGGKAVPNTDWNGDGTAGSGTPINFFNDFANCGTAVTSDCYRWELFSSPLLPGATTAGRKVGFTVDKNVTNVGVYIVVAADLLDHPPVPPQPGLGALLGVASSPQLGFLTGVMVTLTPGGQTAVTDGLGKFLFSGLSVGAFTASLSGLPASCGTPASVSGAITSGGVSTADFVVSCVPTTGSLSGQVERVDNGSNGVVLVPMPGIGIALGGRSAITDPNGSFTLTGLAPGNYVIDESVLTGLGNCQTYGGPTGVTVVAGQTGPAPVTLVCFATLQGQITSSQGPVSQVVVQFGNNYGYQPLATSNAAGQYQAHLPTGDYNSVAVQLPSGCTQLSPAAPQLLTFAMGQVITLDFVLDCTPPSGTVSGTLTGVTSVSAGSFGPMAPTVTNISFTQGGTVAFAAPDASQAYSVDLAPGAYQVQANISPVGQALSCFSPGFLLVVGAVANPSLPPLAISCPGAGVTGIVSLDGTYVPLASYVEIYDASNLPYLVYPLGFQGVQYILSIVPGASYTAGLIVPGLNSANCPSDGQPFVAAAGQFAVLDLSCTSQ